MANEKYGRAPRKRRLSDEDMRAIEKEAERRGAWGAYVGQMSNLNHVRARGQFVGQVSRDHKLTTQQKKEKIQDWDKQARRKTSGKFYIG